MEHLSVWELCEGNQEGGSFTGDAEGYGGSLWRWASLSIGAPLGDLEGGPHTRVFTRWMKEGSGNAASLSGGAL